jgi:hypothetical protein
MSRDKIRIARIGQPAWANIHSVKVAADDRPRRTAAGDEQSVAAEKPAGVAGLRCGGAGGGMLAFVDLLEAENFDDRVHKLRRAALREANAVMEERERQQALARRKRR